MKSLHLFIAIWFTASSLPAGEPSIAERIAGRDFPSVFQAWSPIDNLKGHDALALMARHDLVWHAPQAFGLEWDRRPTGLAEGFTPESIAKGRTIRKTLLGLNPTIVLITEIRYRDAHLRFLPRDHPWWARDKNGTPISGWAEGGYLQLDFRNPAFRAHVARRAKAAVESGVVDGILLDWWQDDEDRLALVKAVRQAIGEKPLIIANTNDRTAPRTASYINGLFMECYRSATPAHWKRIAETLTWAEQNLRTPRATCVETWYHTSREDLHLMRAVTTLTLTRSNGYCLFSDPNSLPTGDHRHNWYAFWDAPLGKPRAEGVTRSDGAFQREFDTGTALYNPMGNRRVTVVFPEARTSAATGTTAVRHELGSPDGDLYLKPENSG